MHIIVLGGGVIGVTTAWFLNQAGHEVTVIDREAEPGAEASFANGGMLHASHTEPWNTPAAVGQFLRWIGREDSPLLLRPSQIPNLVGWGLGFLAYSRPRHHERNTLVNARLAVYSIEMMQHIRESTGLTYDDARSGILKIFHDEPTLETALHGSELIKSLGVDYRRIGVDEVLELDPALADIRDDLIGGIYYPRDEIGDCYLFTRRLAERAAEAGVDFRLGETIRHIEGDGAGVTAVRTDRGRLTADRYVLAAGADAGRLARPLGLRLPIRPVKGYSATVDVTGLPGVPRMPLIDDARKVVISMLGKRLRVAGTAEFAGFDRSVNTRRVGTVLEQALANLPTLSEHIDRDRVEPWACLRPMTMDGPPLLGATPVPNLFLNAGSGHLGWTFAAGAGRVVADVVGGKKPEIDLDGLEYARYGRG